MVSGTQRVKKTPRVAPRGKVGWWRGIRLHNLKTNIKKLKRRQFTVDAHLLRARRGFRRDRVSCLRRESWLGLPVVNHRDRRGRAFIHGEINEESLAVGRHSIAAYPSQADVSQK